VLGDQDPVERLGECEVPALDELRLHQGTVWRWNRAIDDDASGGHLRIEMRALPSGPTITDMLANLAAADGRGAGAAHGARPGAPGDAGALR
jgi:hypothetical protein